jgi:hypothetical protein
MWNPIYRIHSTAHFLTKHVHSTALNEGLMFIFFRNSTQKVWAQEQKSMLMEPWVLYSFHCTNINECNICYTLLKGTLLCVIVSKSGVKWRASSQNVTGP